MYTDPAEMQQKIDEYFRDCEGHPLYGSDGEMIYDKYDRPIIVGVHPPTVTGLALALGFSTRKSLLDYQGKKEFISAITRAKTKVEQYCEERLFDKDGFKGAEFSLRLNFKWKDDAETADGGGGTVEIPAVLPEEAPHE